jgi:hypothetical protein
MAQRVQLSDVLDQNQMPDPFMSDNWELQIQSILPILNAVGITVAAPPNAALRIQCKSLSLPGVSNEVQEMMIAGYKQAIAGKTTYPGTLTIAFTERRDLLVYTALQGWVRGARNPKTQRSLGKSLYSVFANLNCFSEDLALSKTILLKNLWCYEVPDVSLDNTSAALVDISASFRYDDYDILAG